MEGGVTYVSIFIVILENESHLPVLQASQLCFSTL